MAEAFLAILVENLSSLIQGEIGLIMGVDKEMEKLSSTLTTIQAVLEDAEEKQLESKPIRNWLRKLNDLSYEIDDILDECATEVSKLRHKNSKSIRHRLKKILSRRKIGRRMKEVTEKLDAIAVEREKFHLREIVVVERQNKASTTRETSSVLNEPHHVFGRVKEKDEIVEILVNKVRDCQQLSVQPIIGIGGLGKTTLAQVIYNDPRVTEHFDKKLWVCVSDDFDSKILVKAMIESASGSGSASDLVHLDALQRRLWELLNQKRYLLILDDVWNDDQEKWAMLKNVLACGSIGASIVVTTRLKKVADIMGTLPAHHLSGLSEEHCWLLFRQRAFGQDVEEHPNLEAIGRKIVKKCAGVPLAAKALGGILRFKREEKEWLHVKESEIWNLPQEALILPALRLSYHHLPLQLRRCFAYCAVFHKDCVIGKEDLIFCWMAHGYISSNGILEVEDVGNEIWKELVLRSFFQDVKTRFGEITFTMHDLVHDLAQSIMENKVPGVQAENSDRGVSNNSKIRQVNLRLQYMAFPRNILLDMDMSSIIMSFSRLRMLDASGSYDIEELPSAIGNLKRLRYLKLSYCKFRTLPNTICRLWNLKILKLDYCKKLVNFPDGMRYMSNLRHLFLEGCQSLSRMPPKIGELTSLKTLSVFIVDHERGNQLGELECLNLGGRLTIRHLERVKNHMDAKKANLSEKPNLRHLVLEWEDGNPSESHKDTGEKVLEALEPHPNLENLTIIGFYGRRFPLWMRMDNIIQIVIKNCPNCSHLPAGLGDLPHLKSLTLTNLVVLEYIMEDDVQSGNLFKSKFPSLEELKLHFLPNLKGLSKEEVGEMFLNLQELDIEKCPLLILPPLSSLKTLKASSCSDLTLTSFSKLDNLTSLYLKFDENMTKCIPKEALENLSNLEMLEIENAHEHSLPVEGFRGLKSLTGLSIHDCDQVACFPEGWSRHLTALQSLGIHSCNKLVELPKGIRYLQSLKHLSLRDLPNMVCLPEVLQHVPSLEFLALEELPKLSSLPDWFGNFTSLKTLVFFNCPSLASLPASVLGMTNLRTLRIWWCPELERRCEKGKGEDWHKIAHIPRLDIGTR